MIKTEWFRHANGTIAKSTPINVIDRNTDLVVATAVTDLFGMASVDLPEGQYAWRVFGYDIPFDIDISEPVEAAPPYVHQQTVPSAQWIINHNRGSKPPVTLIIDDDPVFADLEYPSLNTVIIELPEPMVGTAYIT